DNRTKRNFKRMYLLSTDHFDKLKSYAPTNPDVQRLLDFGAPYYETFLKLYNEGGNQEYRYRQQTDAFEKLIAELSGRLARRWDVRIQVEYDIDTSEYQGLMADGRSPFQEGAYDLRIDAVLQLASRLRDFPALAALQTDVEEFGVTLQKARTAQQGKESRDQEASILLERARKALAKAMHGIMGQLHFLHFENPKEVEKFYELKYLRTTRSGSSEDEPEETVTVKVPAEESITVLADKLEENDVVRLTNLGGINLKAYAAGDEANAITIEPALLGTITIQAGQTAVVIQNEGSVEGEILVELV
ncbi:MAG: hypothetical protein AAF734_11490, partial [Bacteroidota bacterium]